MAAARATSATRALLACSQAVDEVGYSRIVGGVHFRKAVDDGAALGRKVRMRYIDFPLTPQRVGEHLCSLLRVLRCNGTRYVWLGTASASVEMHGGQGSLACRCSA
jgi:hypothetical protein